MNKRTALHIIYWGIILVFLTLFFGQSWESYTLSFYYASLLLPIVMGTTYFFNLYLVPRYLIAGKYWTLALYSFYMLVVSLYLEILVALFSFAIIANYKIAVMNVMSTSIFVLGSTLYLIVFVTSFIRLVLQLQTKAQHIATLEQEKNRNSTDSLAIRANRKTQHIPLDQLLFIESLDDYVKLTTETSSWQAREKISKLHAQLPDHFIRIHRSFVVNKEKISAYTHNQITIKDSTFPIGRAYKKKAMEKLKR